jgi:hypothetical protein
VLISKIFVHSNSALSYTAHRDCSKRSKYMDTIQRNKERRKMNKRLKTKQARLRKRRKILK